MIKINLLPPEYAEAQKRREMQVIGGGVGGAILFVLLLFWFVKSRQVAGLEKKIAEAQAEKQRFEVIIAEIKQIEADKAAKQAKLNVIKNLNRSRLIYPVFFEDFIPLVPADIWISNMKINESGSSINIEMSCKATNNFAVASWLSNFEQSPHFSKPELQAISYSKNENITELKFNLNVAYSHKGPMPLSEIY